MRARVGADKQGETFVAAISATFVTMRGIDRAAFALRVSCFSRIETALAFTAASAFASADRNDVSLARDGDRRSDDRRGRRREGYLRSARICGCDDRYEIALPWGRETLPIRLVAAQNEAIEATFVDNPLILNAPRDID